jgi:hypothetical protein
LSSHSRADGNGIRNISIIRIAPAIVDQIPRRWLNVYQSATQDSAHLIDVIHIMGGHVPTELFHGQLAAFGVHTLPLPLLRGEPGKHPQVRFTQRTEHFQRFVRLP